MFSRYRFLIREKYFFGKCCRLALWMFETLYYKFLFVLFFCLFFLFFWLMNFNKFCQVGLRSDRYLCNLLQNSILSSPLEKPSCGGWWRKYNTAGSRQSRTEFHSFNYHLRTAVNCFQTTRWSVFLMKTRFTFIRFIKKIRAKKFTNFETHFKASVTLQSQRL